MNKRTDPSQILNSKHPQNVKEYKDIILKELEKPRMKHLVDSIKKANKKNTNNQRHPNNQQTGHTIP